MKKTCFAEEKHIEFSLKPLIIKKTQIQ